MNLQKIQQILSKNDRAEKNFGLRILSIILTVRQDHLILLHNYHKPLQLLSKIWLGKLNHR